MNCDGIAPFYVWIERAAFGKRLERHRLAFLDCAAGARRALVLGDGDGRFVAALAARYPGLGIDCVELSARMVALAKKRLGHKGQRVCIVQGDALTVPLPFPGLGGGGAALAAWKGGLLAGMPALPRYDVVYSHFFLDCFTAGQISVLAGRIASASGAGTRWVISDFRRAESGWRKVFTALWIKTMYVFFRVVTGLEQQELPDHHAALREHGFQLREERVSMAGLIVSECWQR
jgi:SAM-dependent methyltransferase